MACSSRRASASFALLLVSVLFATETPAEAAEPAATPSPADGAAANPSGGGRRSTEREDASEIILCRGPHGAVYARTAAEGCRYARLTPENLVDFGALGDCMLRRAASGERDADLGKIRTCNDVCAKLGDGRACVVGLQRAAGGGWETFSPEKVFVPGEESLREATVVCCRR